jgi:cytochrome c553
MSCGKVTAFYACIVGLRCDSRYNRRLFYSINADEIETSMRPILLNKIVPIALLLSVFPLGSAFAAGDVQAGNIKAYTCTGCHGIPGYNNVYPTYKVPKIGGQNYAYLVAALKAYRNGERDHATMEAQASSLNERDIQDISAYFASLPLSSKPSGKAGAVEEKSKVCEACHGVTGKSADPTYPNLAGQHASYLAQALGDYRSSARTNPIMAEMTANLSNQDIVDLAAWFASQQGLQDLSIK